MPEPTVFVDTTAKAAREAEVPSANFDNGANNAASNACGIGINVGGGEVAGTAAQFTLLDQHEGGRTPQASQSIGGYPYNAVANLPASGGTEGTAPDVSILTCVPSDEGDGEVTTTGGASLADLQVGWVGF